MTVQQLIDKLNDIEDKSIVIGTYNKDVYGEYEGVCKATINIRETEKGIILSVY